MRRQALKSQGNKGCGHAGSRVARQTLVFRPSGCHWHCSGSIDVHCLRCIPRRRCSWRIGSGLGSSSSSSSGGRHSVLHRCCLNSWCWGRGRCLCHRRRGHSGRRLYCSSWRCLGGRFHSCHRCGSHRCCRLRGGRNGCAGLLLQLLLCGLRLGRGIGIGHCHISSWHCCRQLWLWRCRDKCSSCGRHGCLCCCKCCRLCCAGIRGGWRWLLLLRRLRGC